MDGLPGCGPDAFDVLLQRRLLRRFAVKAQSTEGTVGCGIRQVEGQLLVAEASHLLEDRDAQNLLGGQAVAAFAGVDPTLAAAAEVFVEEANRLGQAVEHDADRAELACVLMVDLDWHKR